MNHVHTTQKDGRQFSMLTKALLPPVSGPSYLLHTAKFFGSDLWSLF